MKKLLILLFSILISFNSYGKTVCVETNDVQERNGLYYLVNQQEPFTGDNLCVYTNSGQYYSKGKIKKGKEDGNWTSWYENGQKKREKNYKDGKKDGKSTYWYHHGQIGYERTYKDGKKDGKETWWYESGQKNEGTYKDDKCISGNCW